MEFESLKLIDPILNALEKKGYVEPTPIQEKTIPLLLANKDVIGIAQTGTGKTAAFTVPILQKLHETRKSYRTKAPRALILAPTRELAAQISESFGVYGQFLNLRHLAVYGGVSINPQIDVLRRGVDILIATPGRLLDLMNQRMVDLGSVEFLVLDEADRMLDMGFVRDIRSIVSALPRERQSLFFSATMSESVSSLTNDFLNNPVRMEITPDVVAVEKIDQSLFFIDQENKLDLLLDLMGQEKMNCTLIFVGMKHKADKIAMILRRKGISADAIHGNKSQHQRMRALSDFKAGKVKVLVATDIAARGIDVHNISHVINYDLPNEPENYVHRIGRTARAGAKGIAYSFCEARDRDFLHEIERVTKNKTREEEHKYHSVTAKNAVGAAARPLPRGRGRFGGNRGGEGRRNRDNRRSEGRSERPRFGGNRDNRGNRGGNSRSNDRRSESRGRDSSSNGRSFGNRDRRSSSNSNGRSSDGPRRDSGRSFSGRRDSSSNSNEGRSDRSRPRSGGRRFTGSRPRQGSRFSRR